MKPLALIALFMIFSNISYACDCILQPIESDFENIEYVVIAEVIELLDTKEEREEFHYPQDTQKSYRVKIKISKSFKANFRKDQIVELHSEFTNCDPLFSLGESYLLFLYEKDQKFLEVPCTYWGEVSQLKNEIQTISELARKN
ncbi:MAG: hypothetical protein NXI20_14945 [bacterium]|nr:hypothetical protein [bacterium]